MSTAQYTVLVHTRISLRSWDWILRYFKSPQFPQLHELVSVLALLKCAISSFLVNAIVISSATTSLHRKSLCTLQHVTIHISQRILQRRSLLLQLSQVFLDCEQYTPIFLHVTEHPFPRISQIKPCVHDSKCFSKFCSPFRGSRSKHSELSHLQLRNSNP